MIEPGSALIVSDTSVLINFLRIDRMDLIAALPFDIVATSHVAEEILDIYVEQDERYRQAIAAGTIREINLTDEDELQLFAELSATQRIGIGECSAIACAACRGYPLAIDDRQATTQARETEETLVIVGTKDLIVEMIKRGLLTIQDANEIKEEWKQNHRFTLTFESFADQL